MALVGHGYSNPSSILPCILGYALWSYLYHILIISRGLHEFKSIFTKKFPEKNFHAKRLHMNERIKELWEQAVRGDGPHASVIADFAELIVAECLEACSRANEIRHFVPPTQEQVVLSCMREIEQHFGVSND